MIATQIEMANKMAQQQIGNFEDVDHRPTNLIRQTTAIGGGLRPTQTSSVSGSVLGGLFAPLPFTSSFAGGLANAITNPYGSGPSQKTKNDSPPSLYDASPSTSFGGGFNSSIKNFHNKKILF